MRWRSGLALALSVLALASGGAALAQTPLRQPAPDQTPTALEDVLVTGETVEEQARQFVEEVAQPVRQRGLARWARPACFGVVNFSGHAARYIADRLVTRADELGLPVADQDCDPNVLVIGAVDAPNLARAWVARSPGVFRPRFSGSTGRRSDLERFTSSDAAVRWWHVSLPVYFNIFSGETQPAVRIPNMPIPEIRVYSKSQLSSRVRDDLLKVMVLVDIDKLGPVTTDQLCDYLLMVAYAQVDPEGDTAAYETILNLFDDASVPALTSWDRSYLTALYEADPDRRVGSGGHGDRLAREFRRVDDRPAD